MPPRVLMSVGGRACQHPFASRRQQSFREDIGHAAAETYLLTRLTFTLLQYLGVGYRWITKFLALACYATLLLPGFLQVAYYYFFSGQVRRSIVYGDQPRNRLDLYLPTDNDGPKPVVVFVTGGAWIIGYKAWGSLLGRQLAERDIIVACVDYRNFPQGTISDMVNDVSQGISFICNYIADFGGDPKRIYLMGQSAGAHISSCVLLEQAIKESRGEESILWSVSKIKAYFGLSGGYNLFNLVDHFHNRGLDRSIFLSIMEGEKSFERFSPEVRIKDPSIRDAISLLPPIILFHGTSDYSIPSDASKTFANALWKAGASAELILYDGKTHTDLFLQMYLVAEQRVLKVNCLKTGTSESATQVFFGPGPHQQESGEIIGVAVSILSSLVFINVKNRGLFAFTMHGQLFWSAGPVLDQFGYRQGCRRTDTDCYFTSVPVVGQCEASIYISNTQGELYSLSVRSHHFNWIQDFSSFDKVYTVTPGNNGQLYVIVPLRALVLALDASSGNVLWQGSIGPLSTAEYAPVVDSNGWISIGSLDGFLYSFSPAGTLKKFPNSATLDSVIQISPMLACSGFAIYISQTKMNGKIIHTNGGYTYVSAMKPISVVFSLFVPATGSIYWSESYPGQFASLLSQSDLQHFVLDESLLLAFVTAAECLLWHFLQNFHSFKMMEILMTEGIGNPIPCSTTRQMLASSCSQTRPTSPVIYSGNEKAILLFLSFESVVLLVLAVLVRFCCIFWRKKKLQGQQLGNFLEKRRSLQLKKKAFDRTITELEQKAAEEAVANEVIEKLRNLVQERESTERKLSTTYSLGRDGAGLHKSKSLLPMYDNNIKRTSYSFRNAKKESVAIFHTLSDTSSRESSTEKETTWDSEKDKESSKGKAKAKALLEDESSSDNNEKKYSKSSSEPASSSMVYINPLFVEEEKQEDKRKLVESLSSGLRRVFLKRRRTLSSTH